MMTMSKLIGQCSSSLLQRHVVGSRLPSKEVRWYHGVVVGRRPCSTSTSAAATTLTTTKTTTKTTTRSLMSSRPQSNRGASSTSILHHHNNYNNNYNNNLGPNGRCHHQRVFRRALSSSSSSSSSSNNEDPPPPLLCDVIQGPSLLRTPVSRPNPSLLFLPGLRSLPFWTSQEDTKEEGRGKRIAYGDPTVSRVVQYLESHSHTIREEYLKVSPTLKSDYQPTGHDTELHDGQWDWYSYMAKGSVQGAFALEFPETCKILNDGLRRGPDNDDHLLFEGTPFGFAFFSTLHGRSSIKAHTAPMNFRLRIHLPLIVPGTNTNTDTDTDGNNDASDGHDGRPVCGIRVGPMVRPWIEDSAMVLDDSYDHEVWNHTPTSRVLLLVDIWHPDVTTNEKMAIVDMFQKAKQDGLWKR